ncbi:pentatricopeptide repeat-containing protein At3g04760, chloroplastic isoform X2 [Andrographis paniculata]|nr:pentatricopeptide repeat-containing protein At3g04760, chloroplastic isoform X2 [Andrographis paniculata]
MPYNSSLQNKIRRTLATTCRFWEPPVFHRGSCNDSCGFYKHLFTRLRVISYFYSSLSSDDYSSAPDLASNRLGPMVERDGLDDRKRYFGEIRGVGSHCSVEGSQGVGESEEVEMEESGEDSGDELRVLDSCVSNKHRSEVPRRIEVGEEELRHPLVREICRLVDRRAAWTPKLEWELRGLLRSLKPIQVCAVLQSQSDERVALNFFYWADRQWRYRHNPLVYHAMLNVLGKTKLCQGAKRILLLMMRRKIEIWPEDFCCAMVSFSRAGHLRKAMQLLNLLQRARVELNILICNTALNVLVERKRLEKVLRFIQRMQVIGIEPNVITYNCLIKCYCERNQVEEAMKVISEMPLRCCSPDKVTYYTVMGYLCKDGRIDELRGVIERMWRENKLLPDQVTYNTVIHMLSKYGHAEEALKFLHEAEERGFCVDKMGHTAILNCFCQEGRMDRAKYIVEEMLLKGCTPDVVTYTAVVDGFCRLGEVDQAKKMLQHMYKHGCKPNCVSYTALLNGLCQSGNSSEAREMMNMSEGWWMPNAVTYSVVMHGFRREGKLFEACDMLREMIRKGFYPSPVEINLLIQSLCQAGRTDQARKIMEECLKSGCAVNVVNFTTVIHGFCQKDDLDAALSVLDDMYLNNKHPDEVTYTVVIDALGRNGKISEATEMTKKMLHCGLLPTPVTYRSLIHHFCQHGRVDDLLKLMDKMLLRKNCKTVYNQILEKLCCFRHTDKAYELLEKVLRKASTFDKNTCHIIMRSYLKNGNPLGSYRVACRMFNRNLVPDLKLCEEVSKKLILEKKLDEADKLIMRFVERGSVPPRGERVGYECSS